MPLIPYAPTPVIQLNSALLEAHRVRLLVKREDMNHPVISGNKWWKLKHNLAEARKRESHTLLTFGGSYSNHLLATAEAAAILGLKSIGIVRGEPHSPLNSMLAYAQSRGMKLHHLTREAYREKTQPWLIEQLREQLGDFFLIPEGGTNALAVHGTREFGEELVREVSFDYVCLPVGTGGTMAGIVQALRKDQRAIGISVLKNGNFLREEVSRWLSLESNWSIETRFDFGGFAKTTPELLDFIERERREHNLPLDPVYTAKALYGVYAMIRDNEIRPSSTVLVIHTGGLWGITQ